jgi:hypothetical protein
MEKEITVQAQEISLSRWRWYLAGVLALGALFRIAAALANGRLWFDEIITWEIAVKPLAQMWHYLAMENHPPLHYILVHFWMQLFGTGEVAVKLSSVLAGVLGIGATGAFARRLFGTRAGLWAAGLTALSTYQVFYSAEARMYPWLYLFGTLSLWMWWEMTRLHTNPFSGSDDNTQSKARAAPLTGDDWRAEICIGVGVKRRLARFRWLWFLSTVAALYTHLGGVFVLVAEAVWYFWRQWQTRVHPHLSFALRLPHAIALMASTLLAWLPWIVVFLREKAQTFNRNAWYFWVDLVEPLPIEATRRFFFFDSYAEFMDLFAWAFVGLALCLAFLTFAKNAQGKWHVSLINDEARCYALFILLIPLLTGFLVHVSVIKIYMIASAGAYLLAGAGLARIRVPRPIPSFLMPAAVSGLFLAHMVGVIVDVKPAWREVGEYVAQHQGEADAVVILSHSYQVALEHYYKGAAPVLPFYPLPDDTGGDTLLRAVRRNWYTILTDKNIDELETMTAGKQKILLVVVGRFFKVERIGVEWFMRRGWRLQSVKQWNDYMVNPEVYLFERPDISDQ